MVAKIISAQIIGLKTDIIEVEVDINRGLQSFNIVGLPDKAIAEAKDRINSAIKNSGFQAPQKGNKKIIVSLAPANLRKEGTSFDLAIALGYLLAAKELNFDARQKAFVGELSLDGHLRPVDGILLMTQKIKNSGFTEIYLPSQNAKEAALIKGIKIFPCRSLKEIADHFKPLPQIKDNNNFTSEKIIEIKKIIPATETKIIFTDKNWSCDFAEIRGQQTAKRGLEIAAAGGHNVAMYGPPGTGKTMLAKAFTTIMPPLNVEEAIEVTGIHSAAGVLTEDLITCPPFRSPHHTSSYVSLVGGGAWPRPGEITLAHRGVLFLDEFPEFDKKVIESLRQPMEDRIINVSRARSSNIFPASFVLIAALNPCPCGFRGSQIKECTCSQSQIQKYSRKISGPIIDRIDLWLDVPPVAHEELSDSQPKGELSQKIRERILSAREKQQNRFQKIKINTNSEMGVKEINQYAPLTDNSIKLLNESAKRLKLSARAYHRIIKLARTIADLASTEQIKEEHLLEALHYRPKNIFN